LKKHGSPPNHFIYQKLNLNMKNPVV